MYEQVENENKEVAKLVVQKKWNRTQGFGLAEEMIFHGAENPLTGHTDTSIPIGVDVNLTYPANTYSVAAQALVTNGVANAKANPQSGTFPLREMTQNKLEAVDTSAGFDTPLGSTDFLI